MKSITSILLLVLAPFSLQAAETGLYFGGAIGGYHVEQTFTSATADDPESNTEAGDFAFQLHGGYQFMAADTGFNMAAEGRVIKGIKTEAEDTGELTDADIYGVYVMPAYAVNEAVDVYLAVGVAVLNVTAKNIDQLNNGATTIESVDNTEVSWGVGIQTKGDAAVRAEVLYLDGLDNWIFGGGLTFRF